MSGKTATDAKVGHQMEDTLIKQLIDATALDGIEACSKVLKVAFKVGLIEHQSISDLRCSPDSLGIMIYSPGNERPICIEVKCRTCLSTVFTELARRNYNSSKQKYVSLCAMDDDLKEICNRESEMIQLLHQCATLGISDGVLVIENASAILLNVIWIELGEDIISSFLECTKDILEKSTDFVFQALKESKKVDDILTNEKKVKVYNAIAKVEDLTWKVLVHSIEYWVAFMRLPLPLKSSKRFCQRCAVFGIVSKMDQTLQQRLSGLIVSPYH